MNIPAYDVSTITESETVSHIWKNGTVGRAMAQAVSRRSPSRRPRFDPGSVHLGFVVDKVAVGQVFLRVLRFSPVRFSAVIFIPPVLHYLEKDKK
jgi:hypothetical protein